MEESTSQATVEVSEDKQEKEVEEIEAMQFKEEDPKMVKMKQALTKYQLKITSFKRKNIELR